jgi:IS4 transposase
MDATGQSRDAAADHSCRKQISTEVDLAASFSLLTFAVVFFSRELLPSGEAFRSSRLASNSAVLAYTPVSELSARADSWKTSSGI